MSGSGFESAGPLASPFAEAREAADDRQQRERPGLPSDWLELEAAEEAAAAPGEADQPVREGGAGTAFLGVLEQPWARPGFGEGEGADGLGGELVAPGAPELEKPGVIGGDDRIRIKDTTGVPWRWICKIDVVNSRGHVAGVGTGVLISNRHVLTAAHVVHDAFENMHQYTVTVIPALDDLLAPFDQYSLAEKPRIRQEYDPTAADCLDWDYALLTLSSPVGERSFKPLNDMPLCFWGNPRCGEGTRFARLDPHGLNGKAAYTAGYPGGKGGRQLWCSAGILHSADEKRRTLYTTADITRGQSGSPVWVVDDRRHCLVGIAAGAGSHSNRVVRVTRELIRQVRAWITEGGETPAMVETEEMLERPVLLLAQPESEAPHDQLSEQQFDPRSVPGDVAAALGTRDWPLALSLAIQAGERDENELTNLLFFARHPELPAEPLKPDDPDFGRLSAEWTAILDKEVWKAITVSAENTDLVVPGDEVTDHHRAFFRGRTGRRLEKLVEDAAREVDLNPGLLGTIMMAETRRPLSYLSSDKVSSYHIGCDDFYEGRAAIRARVPAYAKVHWDRTQTPVEHLNDAKKPRLVKTIHFDSGADGALATAVYIKFGEVRLREIAAGLGGDFDGLPLPTRFALTRMAMAAGTGGATPYLKNALDGVDIFDRRAIPVVAYQTRRNATVRTAQAMHLSDWVFSIPVQRATRPAEHELESWGEAEEPVRQNVPGSSTTVVAVGEQVVLDVRHVAFAGDVDDVRWTIPGTAVRGYDGGTAEATLTPLTDADLRQPRVAFYWVDAADGRLVRATFRTKSGSSGRFVRMFDVTAPRVDSFEPTTGETRVETRPGRTAMQFGKPIEAPGIAWHWKVTLPRTHAGRVKDVQTVLSDRSMLLRLEPGGTQTRRLVWRHPSRTELHTQLDSGPEKPDGSPASEAVYTEGLLETTIEAGQSTSSGGRGIEDSPRAVLPPLGVTVSANDQFTYYVMFKPAVEEGRKAIWVPLAKARWSWKVTARHRGQKWDVSAAPMKAGIDKATVDFPLYRTSAALNEWQEPPGESGQKQPVRELEGAEAVAEPLFETQGGPESLAEEFVPDVPGAELRTRIDEFLHLAEAQYTLPGGTAVTAPSQFQMASVDSERHAETLEALLREKLGGKASSPLHTVIRCAAYGRARPDEIGALTQQLIDLGELDAVRKANPTFTNRQLVRALQSTFHIGIDCAGYVQLAFIFAFTGKQDDARCNLATSALRQGLGLKAKRSDENLAALPEAQFTAVDFLEGRTGDLFVLAWRKGEHDWHTVVVADHTVAGDIHTFVVDASWGRLYGPDEAGIQRRAFLFDKAAGMWWDVVGGTKQEPGSAIGPYNGHPIKGMYRAKERT